MYFTEYLPRINSIAVAVDCGEVKQILPIPSGLKLVTDNDIEIKFPIETTGDVKLANLNRTATGIAFNASLVQETTKSNHTSFMSLNSLRWSCKDLQKTPLVNNANQFTFNCLNCDKVIIDSTSYKFQDMPSELWYELMDFWHCHKPHNHQKHDKNYEGILRPQSDTAVVIGNHYLLVNNNSVLQEMGDEVACKSCGSILGDVDHKTMRLLKWKLSLHYSNIVEKFPSHLYIYNLMVDKINSLATRKFKFKLNNQWWYIWVLNLGLQVSANGHILHDAMKLLFYKDDGNNVDFEEYDVLDVPYPELLQEFTNQLHKINALLPESNKSIKLNSTNYTISYLSQEYL